MAAQSTTTEDSIADLKEKLDLITRFYAILHAFLRDCLSSYIHKVLITTDIALVVIFGLSFGEVAPLAPALYALLAVHLLFYGLPTALGLWHFGLDGVHHVLPTKRDKYDLTRRLSAYQKKAKQYPHLWLKSSVVILAFPFVIAELQSRLSGTSPETAALIETVFPVVPVIQRFVVTFLTLFILFRLFLHTIMFVMKYQVQLAEEAAEAMAETQ
ncbi:hypothetical protein [Haloarcula sp. Atlit-7R]|uniref:hypothetical protein n=1 Tax=Haloarcula sp. Atlit-7R TaxID=2282125 RepID=UPI000EF16210|nr:hypothetical protein [Haloarcula sp. Atlit-7R]RLM94290.1 hypothetical protein D3D01_15620 [Haloarcula sp. Atlit-7R]